jgi:CubicO group peptidase (beta-lactamase class C family)
MISTRKSPLLPVLFIAVFFSCSDNPGKNKSEKIDYVLQQAVEGQEFVGSILVAEQGKVIYKRSFGKTNSDQLLNTDSTKFPIASISKPITAILIIKLAEQGKLNVTDTIGEFFDANGKIGGITIHQLLTHTSGLKEFINEQKGMDITALIKSAGLNFDPGSDFEYCNSAYVVLKAIAEKATGETYTQLINQHVLLPAGMKASGILRTNILTKIAQGYNDASQEHSVGFDFPPENVDGAGSVYSTVGDLYKLDSILATEALMSASAKEQMYKQYVAEKYAYGWYVRERAGEWSNYYHRGNLPGYTSLISRDIKKGWVIVMLSNAEDLDLADIENDIARILGTDKV